VLEEAAVKLAALQASEVESLKVAT